MRIRRSLLIAAILAGGLPAMPARASVGDDLIAATQDGLEPQVKALLVRHADVNATDATGATALAWAIMRGNADLVPMLLKAHANPNLADANGVTPLMLAIDNSQPEIVKQLLAAGADPNVARPDGETPLMDAVSVGAADIAGMLVEAKADVNAREHKFGQTALMWAAGYPQITRLLLAHGADTAPVTKSWETASTNYTPNVTTLGITGIPWNNDGDYTGRAGGFNALLFAVQKNDIDSVRQLLDAGMDVNFAAADGTTPLLTALYKWDSGQKAAALDRGRGGVQGGEAGGVEFAPDFQMANLLLDRGAKAGASDRAGYSPLHGAILAMVRSTGRGQYLIGFNPNRTTRTMPAQPKTSSNEAEGLALVTRLLDAGADPNKMTSGNTPGPLGAIKVNPAPAGSTPFHIAAATHSAKLIDLMAAHGANPNILRKDGHTPLTVAVMMNDLPVVTEMVAHGADLQMHYNPADKLADPVQSKAEVRKDQTILHIAGAANANYVVEFLAAKGAPLKLKNDHGETPLDLADEQELFRYNHDLESQAGDRIGAASKSAKIVRDSSTTDAFKRAMGMKTKLASN